MRRFRDLFVTGQATAGAEEIQRRGIGRADAAALPARPSLRAAAAGARKRPDLALAPGLCHTSPEPARGDASQVPDFATLSAASAAAFGAAA